MSGILADDHLPQMSYQSCLSDEKHDNEVNEGKLRPMQGFPGIYLVVDKNRKISARRISNGVLFCQMRSIVSHNSSKGMKEGGKVREMLPKFLFGMNVPITINIWVVG